MKNQVTGEPNLNTAAPAMPDAAFAPRCEIDFYILLRIINIVVNMENIRTGKPNLMKFKKLIVPVLKRNDVVRAGIFGSFARGEAKKNSDIDILIKIKAKKFSLLDLIGLELELEEKLKRRVDLVEYSAIHPLLKERILKEEVRIL